MNFDQWCWTFRPKRRVVGALFILAVLLAGSCAGSSEPVLVEASNVLEPEIEECVIPGSLVPALEVEVFGPRTPQDEAIVAWALERFSLVDLELTTPIEVRFDPSRTLCNGEPGRCLLFTDAPAELYVCEEAGDTAARIADQRLTVLHELAHVWHFAQGDRRDWPDSSTIVGGESSGIDVEWNDRTFERVADVISWGLMDDERRKARGIIPCREMYTYFVALTGHQPLEPLNPACVPDEQATNQP